MAIYDAKYNISPDGSSNLNYYEQLNKDAGKYIKRNNEEFAGVGYFPTKPNSGSRSAIDRMFDFMQIGVYSSQRYLNSGIKSLKNVYESGKRGESFNPMGIFDMYKDAHKSAFEGIKAGNPFGERYEEGEFHFSDNLGELGWNPTSKVGQNAKFWVGLAGDIAFDPLTYVNPIGTGIVAVMKGTGKKVGKEVVEKFTAEMAEKVLKSTGTVAPTAEKIADTVRRVNKARGIFEEGTSKGFGLYGDNLGSLGRNLGLDGKKLELISEAKLRAFGDATFAKYTNKLGDNILRSKVGRAFTTKADLLDLARKDPEALVKGFEFARLASVNKLDLAEAIVKLKDQVDELKKFSPESQKQIMNILEDKKLWEQVTSHDSLRMSKEYKDAYEDALANVQAYGKGNPEMDKMFEGMIAKHEPGSQVVARFPGMEDASVKIEYPMANRHGERYYKVEGYKTLVPESNLLSQSDITKEVKEVAKKKKVAELKKSFDMGERGNVNMSDDVPNELDELIASVKINSPKGKFVNSSQAKPLDDFDLSLFNPHVRNSDDIIKSNVYRDRTITVAKENLNKTNDAISLSQNTIKDYEKRLSDIDKNFQLSESKSIRNELNDKLKFERSKLEKLGKEAERYDSIIPKEKLAGNISLKESAVDLNSGTKSIEHLTDNTGKKMSINNHYQRTRRFKNSKGTLVDAGSNHLTNNIIIDSEGKILNDTTGEILGQTKVGIKSNKPLNQISNIKEFNVNTWNKRKTEGEEEIRNFFERLIAKDPVLSDMFEDTIKAGKFNDKKDIKSITEFIDSYYKKPTHELVSSLHRFNVDYSKVKEILTDRFGDYKTLTPKQKISRMEDMYKLYNNPKELDNLTEGLNIRKYNTGEGGKSIVSEVEQSFIDSERNMKSFVDKAYQDEMGGITNGRYKPKGFKVDDIGNKIISRESAPKQLIYNGVTHNIEDMQPYVVSKHSGVMVEEKTFTNVKTGKKEIVPAHMEYDFKSGKGIPEENMYYKIGDNFIEPSTGDIKSLSKMEKEGFSYKPIKSTEVGNHGYALQSENSLYRELEGEVYTLKNEADEYLGQARATQWDKDGISHVEYKGQEVSVQTLQDNGIGMFEKAPTNVTGSVSRNTNKIHPGVSDDVAEAYEERRIQTLLEDPDFIAEKERALSYIFDDEIATTKLSKELGEFETKNVTMFDDYDLPKDKKVIAQSKKQIERNITGKVDEATLEHQVNVGKFKEDWKTEVSKMNKELNEKLGIKENKVESVISDIKPKIEELSKSPEFVKSEELKTLWNARLLENKMQLDKAKLYNFNGKNDGYIKILEEDVAYATEKVSSIGKQITDTNAKVINESVESLQSTTKKYTINTEATNAKNPPKKTIEEALRELPDDIQRIIEKEHAEFTDYQALKYKIEVQREAIANQTQFESYAKTIWGDEKYNELVKKHSSTVRAIDKTDWDNQDIIDVAKDIHKIFGEVANKELEAGQLSKIIEGYATHVANPKFVSVLDKYTAEELANMGIKIPSNSFDISRKYKIGTEMPNGYVLKHGTVEEINGVTHSIARDINKMLIKAGKDPIESQNLFLDQISDVYLNRMQKHYQLMYDHNVYGDLANKFGTVYGERVGDVRNIKEVIDGAEVWSKMRIDPKTGEATIVKNGDTIIKEGHKLTVSLKQVKEELNNLKPENMQKAMERLGLTPEKLDKLGSTFMHITEDEAKLYNSMGIADVHQIADNVLNKAEMLGKTQFASDTHGLLKVYDKFLLGWKKMVTAYTPSFHINNIRGNTFNNYLDVGMLAMSPKMQTNAIKIMKNEAGELITKSGKVITFEEIARELKLQGIADTGFFGTIRKVSTDEIPKKLGVLKSIDNGIMNASSNVEYHAKVVNFISNLHLGKSFTESAEHVNKFLFDYSNITKFEHDVMQRIIPFYTWISKNAPLQLEQMLTNPKRYMPIAKAISDLEDLTNDNNRIDKSRVPAFARDWVQLPFNITNEKGKEEALMWSNNLPYMDVNKIPNIFDLKGSLSTLFESVTPFAKMPIELGTNYNYFFDKPIDKGDKVSDPSGLFKVSPQLGYVLGQIPQYSIAGGVVRKDGLDKLIHILDKGLATGVKSYDNVQYGGRTIQERNENDAYYNSYHPKFNSDSEKVNYYAEKAQAEFEPYRPVSEFPMGAIKDNYDTYSKDKNGKKIPLKLNSEGNPIGKMYFIDPKTGKEVNGTDIY